MRAAAALAGAAVAAPLPGGSATAQAAPGSDADALFKAGRFEQAGRAYEEILRNDPTNLHAARQRGYVGLLGNKFPDAEKYLTMAIELAPDDKDANYFLADCYIRQDKFSLSVPHWQAIGENAYATWFASIRGEAYQIHGDTARVEWLKTDPQPQVAASINGGPAKRLTFYTGAPSLSLTSTAAKEAGLTPVASQEIPFEGGTIWAHYGVLDSIKLGDIELRNVPVGWSTTKSGDDVDTEDDGLIGTWVFYHLLTTFDYAGRSLILRRPTPEAAREVRAAATRAGVKPLPLRMAREQYLHSTGSINGTGPRVVGVNLGGSSEAAAVVKGETVEELRIRTDYDRPIQTFGHSHPVVAYPCYPKEIRLGIASAQDIYSYTNPRAALAPNGFDVAAAYFHPFWKPYNITLDFTTMNLYLAPGAAS